MSLAVQVPDHTLIDKQCFNDIQIETNFKVRDASFDEITKLNFICGVNDVPDGAKVIALERENDHGILAYMVFTIQEIKKGIVTTVNIHELCGTANNFKSASRFMLIAFARTFTKNKVVFKFTADIKKESSLNIKIDNFFRNQDEAHALQKKKYARDARRDAYYHAGKDKFTEMIKPHLDEADFVQQLLEIGFKVAVVRRQKEGSKYFMVLELISMCEDGRQEFRKSKRKLETEQPVPLTLHTARRLRTSEYLPGPSDYDDDFIFTDLEHSLPSDGETLPALPELGRWEEFKNFFT